MAHDWLADVVQAAAEAAANTTHDWRTVNRVGCLFAVIALFGLLWALVAAVGGEPLRPGGWWLGGGPTAVGVLGAAGCFRLGGRPGGGPDSRGVGCGRPAAKVQ